ncbi:MAG: hypothetical protein R2799_09355 [Crocinitomicaceae bacterium]
MKVPFSIFFSLFSLVAFTQYKVTKIDKEFGLMSDNVKGVWLDEEGYIWVADEIGLNRVNGNEVLNYVSKYGPIFEGWSNRFFYRNQNLHFYTNDKFGVFSGNQLNLIDDTTYNYDAFIETKYIINGDTLDMKQEVQIVGEHGFTTTFNVSFLDGDSLLVESVLGKKLKKKLFNKYLNESEILSITGKENINQVDLKSLFWISEPFFQDAFSVFIAESNGNYIQVTRDLSTKKLNFKDIPLITRILSYKNNFLVSHIRNSKSHLFLVNDLGQILDSIDVLEGYYLNKVIGNDIVFSKYNLLTEKKDIAIYNVETNNVSLYNNVRSFGQLGKSLLIINDNYELIRVNSVEEEKIHSFDPENSHFSGEFKVIKDSEQIYWLHFNNPYALYKITPNSLQYKKKKSLVGVSECYSYNDILFTFQLVLDRKVENGYSSEFVADALIHISGEKDTTIDFDFNFDRVFPLTKSKLLL